jgi:hypothetical protein
VSLCVFRATASQSNFIGYQAGVLATNAGGSTFIGSQAGRSAVLLTQQLVLMSVTVQNKSIGLNNILVLTYHWLSGKTNSGSLFGTGVYSTITGIIQVLHHKPKVK